MGDTVYEVWAWKLPASVFPAGYQGDGWCLVAFIQGQAPSNPPAKCVKLGTTTLATFKSQFE